MSRTTRKCGSRHRVYDLFRDGRFVLLQRGGLAAGQSGPVTGAELPRPVRSVRYIASEGARLPAAALVRPDGYLAWASDDPDPAAPERASRAAVCPLVHPSSR